MPDIHTYQSGFDIHFGILTSKTVVAICTRLESRFAGHVFRPEPIGEGGILWVDWPGKTEKMYKTMRFHFPPTTRWPWIHDSTFDEWKESDKNLYFGHVRENGRYGTFFKAFDGAPAWTPHEQRMFMEVLQELGFELGKAVKLGSGKS